MRKNFLDLYYQWLEAGKLPYEGGGLCLSLKMNGYDHTYSLIDSVFKATEQDKIGLYNLWYKHPGEFNPLRQNMLLLLAAMNNEL